MRRTLATFMLCLMPVAARAQDAPVVRRAAKLLDGTGTAGRGCAGAGRQDREDRGPRGAVPAGVTLIDRCRPNMTPRRSA